MEPFQKKAVGRVTGLEVVTREKLGILSLEKTEEMMGISSSISKLLHD